jgi:hypothetical protein
MSHFHYAGGHLMTVKVARADMRDIDKNAQVRILDEPDYMIICADKE